MDIRNKNGKKVCEYKPEEKTIEILAKGLLTKITFANDGSIVVTNS